ncbi:putative damage-inducible protein DinB [Catalinimonas alkaloidigena]|uniref:DinB family protein n=1 Tax=Catalinimonas alkaloidigena TaxID=1075417 RepID=UPI0024057315|nr:DinB family protein [Catalinimonas alkaloidigena]MDF9795759.1 putative damage-inducible protein DinB [Catalinimonas alkaloidigena]
MDTTLKSLFDYNQYANKLFIRSFTENNFNVEKGIKLFSHIINAHHIWLARIKDEAPIFDVWEIHVINSFAKVNEDNYSRSIQLLQEANDLHKVINYTNSKGNTYQNTIRDILLHIVNHSTYHRGQVATLIRENGMEPPVTDYIFYKRDEN